jgi:hypothetical protein
MIPPLKDLKNKLFNEDKCIHFLLNKQILKKSRACLQCNSSMYQEKKIFRCINRQCHKSISIFANTFFTRNKITCSDAMLIGYLWLSNVNYTVIQNVTNHNSNTIIKYIKLFRELVIKTLNNNDQMIGNRGVIVEIDESLFSNKKGEPGIWIIGGVERSEKKKCFFKVIKNRDTKTIKDIVLKHIKPRSIVMSDMWKGYKVLKELNMKHISINHGKNFVCPKTGGHTNTIEVNTFI